MKLLKWSGGIITLLLLLFVAFVLLPTKKEPPIPSPNGFMTLVSALNLLPPSQDIESLNKEEKRQYIADSEDAMNAAREAFEQESRVIIGYAESLPNPTSILVGARNLEKIFVVNGEMAESDGAYSAAAASYLDTMKIGVTVGRGGTMINRLVGMACEAVGLSRLKPLLGELSYEDCLLLLSELRFIMDNSDTVQETFRNENAWLQKTQTLKLRLQAALLEFVPNSSLKKSRDNFEQTYEERALAIRSFLLKVAARAYELEHGIPPKTADDLVPEYLNAVPVDPATGKPLGLPETPL